MASSLTAEPVGAYLDGSESVEYRLASDGPVERELDGTVSTLSPAGEFGSLLAVTNARVLILVGGGDRRGDDALVSIPYPEVAGVDVTDGLVRTGFAVETTARETYSLSPDEGELQAAAEYVRRVAEKCERVRTLVEKASLDSRAVETDTDLDVSAIESDTTERTLTQAHATLTDLDDGAMHGLDELRDRIESLWLHNYIERGDRLQERARSAGEAGREDDAIDALAAAVESYDAALSIAVERDFSRTQDVREKRDHAAKRLSTLRVGPAERGQQAVERALETSGEDAAEAWLTAYEAYGEALDATGLDLPVDVDDPTAAVRYQRVWVARRAIDALRAQATALADAVDDDGERAADVYDRALEFLDVALAIADEQGLSTDALAAEREAIEEKNALLQWEWGDNQ